MIQWWNSADLLITVIHQSLNHQTRDSSRAQTRATALKVVDTQHFITFPFVLSHTAAQQKVLLCSTDTSCKFLNRRKEETGEEGREGGGGRGRRAGGDWWGGEEVQLQEKQQNLKPLILEEEVENRRGAGVFYSRCLNSNLRLWQNDSPGRRSPIGIGATDWREQPREHAEHDGRLHEIGCGGVRGSYTTPSSAPYGAVYPHLGLVCRTLMSSRLSRLLLDAHGMMSQEKQTHLQS